MKIKSLLLALLSITAILPACKNDIEINAPWKETPVIYGFIDPNQTAQYIRITKTFQNALNLTPQQAAQLSDSLYFDTLQVTLTDMSTNAVFPLHRIDTTKDAGYFASDKNYLYTCNMSPVVDHAYRLDIFSPKSGKTYSATSNVVGPALIMPNAATYTLNIKPYRDDNFYLYRWDPAKNGVIYDAIIRYEYSEYPVGQPQNKVDKYADQYVAFNDETVFTFVRPTIEMNVFLKNALPYVPGVERAIRQVDYVVISGSPDLKTAIDISKPSTSLLQVKPEYTNIPGGLGVFTSRSTSIKVIPFANDSSKYYLTKGVANFPQ